MSPCRTFALFVIASRLRTTFGGSLPGLEGCSVIGGARRVTASMIGGSHTGFLVMQDSADPQGAKVFPAHAAPQGMCDNLINPLKLLTHQQKDGDSPVGTIVTGFVGEKSQQYCGRAQKVH